MYRSVSFAVLVCLLIAIPALAVAQEMPPGPARIASSELQVTPRAVEAWDSNSVQELFDIDGELFQLDSGFYYRVVKDQISVRLSSGFGSWSSLLRRVQATDPGVAAELERLTPLRRNQLGIVDLQIPDGSPVDWCRMIHETGLVRYAEIQSYGVFTVSPNDPLYPQQWALNNTGQTGGTPGADMDAELAWEISAGDPSVVVAVLDSGTLITHPDLAPNVWTNLDEIPNNGQDDDGNGFIDDTNGWDFGNNNNNVASGNFHGTHVTGCVAARGGNGIGIAGLAGGVGGPGVQTMAVAVGEGGPITSIIDDAILYAVNNGARVITFSLTVGSTQATNDALQFAYVTNDVFIDCASGNGGSSVGYPANQSQVMAVASTTDDDVKSGFSNPGPQVEVAAPGSNILSTQLGNGYGTSSGTSFSAPYVGALAGLIRSVNPGLDAPAVRQLIIDTADDVGAAGFDNGTGFGRINAHQALLQAGSSIGEVGIEEELYACSDSLNLTLSDFDLSGTGTANVTVFSGTEPAGELVLMTESEFGQFTGSIDLGSGSPGPDGILQAGHDETLRVEYIDADDGDGGVNVLRSDTASTDCAGPQITNVASVNVDDQFATLTWNTDEGSDSIVHYGSTIPPSQTESNGSLTSSHAIALGGLDSCTTYKYSVESTDALGNASIDDNGGEYYTFQTLGNFPGVGVVACELGQVQLGRGEYGCQSTVTVSLTDINLDLDNGAIDSAEVLMTSTTDTDGEWITLSETAADTGVFEGTLDLTPNAATPDSLLSVEAGDVISATYFDADNGQGAAAIATATSSADCVGPAIAGVVVTELSSTRAMVQWTTNEPSTSRLEFGGTPALGGMTEDLELKTFHTLPMSAFEACGRAYFRVSGADEFGDVAVSDLSGQPFELNLMQIGGLAFHDNFEADDGWTLNGDWERGTPQADGSGSGDPAAAFSGSGVLGINLTNGGDYGPGGINSAQSPPINTTGMSNLELIIKRKLGLATGDSAAAQVVNFFTQTIWLETTPLDDGDWVEERYSIPAADNQAAVRIGFQLTPDANDESYGWNIDEIIVKDSTQPDYIVCGDCSGAPSFAGLASAIDTQPCGASGINLTWPIAASWGTGGTGSYDIYRGDSASFIPGPGNLIAGGVNGTSFMDNAAPADTPVWYVVRARNDESCGGGVGLDDGNLLRVAAIETSDQPDAPVLGSSVRIDNIGSAHVRLNWDAVAGASSYRIMRSENADFSGAINVGESSGTQFEELGTIPDSASYYYRVFPLNSCGETAP